MAISSSLQFSPPCCRPPHKFTPSSATTTTSSSALSFPHLRQNNPVLISFSHPPIPPRRITVRSTENGSETSTEPETTTTEQQGEVELSEVGAEIKKMLKERKGKEEEDGGFLSGVAEEIQKIEWPEFGKVIGTTGAVLTVIAGSSVVLLTVNALLAEFSDRVFAGKGVQDFFG